MARGGHEASSCQQAGAEKTRSLVENGGGLVRRLWYESSSATSLESEASEFFAGRWGLDNLLYTS